MTIMALGVSISRYRIAPATDLARFNWAESEMLTINDEYVLVEEGTGMRGSADILEDVGQWPC